KMNDDSGTPKAPCSSHGVGPPPPPPVAPPPTAASPPTPPPEPPVAAPPAPGPGAPPSSPHPTQAPTEIERTALPKTQRKRRIREILPRPATIAAAARVRPSTCRAAPGNRDRSPDRGHQRS